MVTLPEQFEYERSAYTLLACQGQWAFARRLSRRSGRIQHVTLRIETVPWYNAQLYQMEEAERFDVVGEAEDSEASGRQGFLHAQALAARDAAAEAHLAGQSRAQRDMESGIGFI